MPEPLFEFFERIAQELADVETRVITPDDFQLDGDFSPLLESLMKNLRSPSAGATIPRAVEKLRKHFEAKGAKLPFEYTQKTGVFRATDIDFLSFVNDMKDMRSIGKRSKDFEYSVAERLRLRATDSIHRVGFPRTRMKSQPEVNRYLQKLGFDQCVLVDKEKDGGFDILWALPVGTVPHRPLVSVQCKNGEFSMEDADRSVSAGRRSLGRNTRLQPSVHVLCVLFNDYLHPQKITKKPVEFVPLGLTDLASLESPITLEFI